MPKLHRTARGTLRLVEKRSRGSLGGSQLPLPRGGPSRRGGRRGGAENKIGSAHPRSIALPPRKAGLKTESSASRHTRVHVLHASTATVRDLARRALEFCTLCHDGSEDEAQWRTVQAHGLGPAAPRATPTLPCKVNLRRGRLPRMNDRDPKSPALPKPHLTSVQAAETVLVPHRLAAERTDIEPLYPRREEAPSPRTH